MVNFIGLILVGFLIWKVGFYQSILIVLLISIFIGLYKIFKIFVNDDENTSKREIKDMDSIKNEDLFFAINTVNMELVKYLIEKGENINKKDNNGNTILMIAIMSYPSISTSKQLELIRLLLEKGANPYIENYKNLNARHIITSKGEIYKELRELFKEFNFFKNTEDANNQYLSSLKISNTIKIDSLETTNQKKINIEDKKNIEKNQYFGENISEMKSIINKQSLIIKNLEDNLKLQTDKINNISKNVQTKQIEQLKIINELISKVDKFNKNVIKSNDIDNIKKEFENKQSKQNQHIEKLVQKIEKLEEALKNESLKKPQKKPLNIPIQIEKQTINKIDGELIKRDSFDDF